MPVKLEESEFWVNIGLPLANSLSPNTMSTTKSISQPRFTFLAFGSRRALMLALPPEPALMSDLHAAESRMLNVFLKFTVPSGWTGQTFCQKAQQGRCSNCAEEEERELIFCESMVLIDVNGLVESDYARL